jgi:hypothetical protein
MLIASFIFVISVAALVQFAVFTWRAGLIHVANEQLSPEAANLLKPNSFEDLATYEDLCPDLDSSSGPKLGSVRAYYTALKGLSSIAASVLPAASSWANSEMALCTRYATVIVAHRLERNQLLAAEARSF